MGDKNNKINNLVKSFCKEGIISSNHLIWMVINKRLMEELIDREDRLLVTKLKMAKMFLRITR